MYNVHLLHLQSSPFFGKLLDNVKRSSAPAYSNLTFSKFHGWEDFVEFMEISLLNWFLIPRSLNFLQIGNIIHWRRLNFAFVPLSENLQSRCLAATHTSKSEDFFFRELWLNSQSLSPVCRAEMCQRASTDLWHKEKTEDQDFGRRRCAGGEGGSVYNMCQCIVSNTVYNTGRPVYTVYTHQSAKEGITLLTYCCSSMQCTAVYR